MEYSYADGSPVVLIDPAGLVTVSQTFEHSGLFGGGGQYSLGFARWHATGSCICGGDKWYIRLHLEFHHRYLCSGSVSCRREWLHANIGATFVVRFAQQWNKYEHIPFSSRGECQVAANAYAADMDSNLFNNAPEDLMREYWLTQSDYESTHHGWPCGWIPGIGDACAAN
jgi:hypothetical protein